MGWEENKMAAYLVRYNGTSIESFDEPTDRKALNRVDKVYLWKPLEPGDVMELVNCDTHGRWVKRHGSQKWEKLEGLKKGDRKGVAHDGHH